MKTAIDRQRLPRRERAEQLLGVAYEEFASRGYERVSMARLAERAGVTKPIIYSHFGSKEGVYAACAERFLAPMLKGVDSATREGGTAEGQLWAGILAQLRFIAEHRREWQVFVRDAAARGGMPGGALVEGRRRVIAMLAELMALAIRTAGAEPPPMRELTAQAHAFQGAVEQIANWWEEFPEEPAEAVALRVMNFAWQGYGAMVAGEYWLPPEMRAAR